MRDTKQLVGDFASLLVVCALLLAIGMLVLVGCNDSPTVIVPPPTPALCPIVLNCTPISGFKGLYSCAPTPEGSYRAKVNTATQNVEFGQLLVAESGDQIQACRDCGCSESYKLR